LKRGLVKELRNYLILRNYLKFFEKLRKKLRKITTKIIKFIKKNTKTNLEIGLDYVLSVTLFRKTTLAKKKCFKRTKVKKVQKKYKICNTSR